jgi:PAS domain S-box-containing protein
MTRVRGDGTVRAAAEPGGQGLSEPAADRAAAVALIAYVRWAGVALGVLQAFLVTDPQPIGGPWFVLLASGVMAAYNVPATLVRRNGGRHAELLRWACLAGDFAVCTAWTLLVANDIYSTTYAIYILVGIEAAFLYGVSGAAWFSIAFLLAYGVLYWERAAFFGFPVLFSSLLFRSAIVLVAVGLASAITEQSQRRRAASLRASNDARLQAELASQRSDELDSLLRAISDMGEGVVTVSEGKIVDANEAYRRLSGYELSELRALSSFLSVVAPEARKALTQLVTPPDIRGASGETVLLTKSGERIPVDWSTGHTRIGNAIHVVGVVRDIRERKRILRLIGSERDRAEEASRAKTEYLSRMSHELRTPMTAILGFAELLQLQARAEDRQAVESILSASGHLLSLINDALDISRIESGKETLSSGPVPLAEVIDECVTLMSPLAEAREISLKVDLSAVPAAYVEADRQKLAQIFLNLLSNGVKYTPAGSTISVKALPSEAQRVRIAVSDNGPGISTHLAERVFEPFERLGAERGGTPGTGLGLALARRLVEAMGGAIGLESAPGAGSTFWVELNVAEPPADAIPALAPAAPESRTSKAVAGEQVVLYVEDNLTTIGLVERIVALRPSIKLLTSMQGSLALDLAREHQPRLILLDVHLPDIDGAELLRQFKLEPRTKDVPVIILSADATQWQRNRLLEAGASRYLTKPIAVAELLEVLDGVLSAGATEHADLVAAPTQ